MRFKRIGEEAEFFGISQLSNEKLIEGNKKLSQNLSKARELAKNDFCLFCNKPVSSFCNSHSIPRFVLDNIDISGELLSSNAILHLPPSSLREETGLNNSGTFQIICNDCDSTIFSDYEDPSAYEDISKVSSKMICEIALKNYMRAIAKRRLERELYKITNEMAPFPICDEKLEVCEIDLINYTSRYERTKKALQKNTNNFYVFFSKLLNYVVPVAFQGMVSLPVGLHGEIINDVYNCDLKYEVKDLHICVFPLKSQTAIILFIDEGDKRYRKFYKEFVKLPLEEQLGIINYIIFLHTEDYYLSKTVYDKVQSQEIQTCSAKSLIAYKSSFENTYAELCKEFDLSNWKSIDNLLSEQYKVR